MIKYEIKKVPKGENDSESEMNEFPSFKETDADDTNNLHRRHKHHHKPAVITHEEAKKRLVRSCQRLMKRATTHFTIGIYLIIASIDLTSILRSKILLYFDTIGPLDY
jgi:hypothetical protein